MDTLLPRTIVEVGAGESTEVIDATNVNAKHVIIEPYRQSSVPKKHTLIAKEIQDVDVTVFDLLEDGDILFLDSSHVTVVAEFVPYQTMRFYQYSETYHLHLIAQHGKECQVVEIVSTHGQIELN